MIAIIRFGMGYGNNLRLFLKTVSYKFHTLDAETKRRCGAFQRGANRMTASDYELHCSVSKH